MNREPTQCMQLLERAALIKLGDEQVIADIEKVFKMLPELTLSLRDQTDKMNSNFTLYWQAFIQVSELMVLVRRHLSEKRRVSDETIDEIDKSETLFSHFTLNREQITIESFLNERIQKFVKLRLFKSSPNRHYCHGALEKRLGSFGEFSRFYLQCIMQIIYKQHVTVLW